MIVSEAACATCLHTLQAGLWYTTCQDMFLASAEGTGSDEERLASNARASTSERVGSPARVRRRALPGGPSSAAAPRPGTPELASSDSEGDDQPSQSDSEGLPGCSMTDP